MPTKQALSVSSLYLAHLKCDEGIGEQEENGP